MWLGLGLFICQMFLTASIANEGHPSDPTIFSGIRLHCLHFVLSGNPLISGTIFNGPSEDILISKIDDHSDIHAGRNFIFIQCCERSQRHIWNAHPDKRQYCSGGHVDPIGLPPISRHCSRHAPFQGGVCDGRIPYDVFGWRLAAVLRCNFDAGMTIGYSKSNGHLRDVEIGPNLGLPNAARFAEGEKHKHDAEKRDAQFKNANAEHEFGPERHVLLGLEITVGTLLFLGGIGFGFFGLQRACNPPEIIWRQANFGWPRLLWWGCLGLLGAGISSAVLTYGLGVCCAP